MSFSDTPRSNGNSAPTDAPSVEVYAVYGAEPEIQAYAMAKYFLRVKLRYLKVWT